MGARFDPFQNLTAHYLLTGLRVAGDERPRRERGDRGGVLRGALRRTRPGSGRGRPEPPDGRLVRRQDRARRRGRRRAGRAASSRSSMPPDIGHVHVAYVAPEHRRRGVTKALLRRARRAPAAAGAAHVTLDVDLSNRDGLAAWRAARLHRLGGPARRRRSTRSTRGSPRRDAGPDFASVHVQTDDEAAVADAVRKYVPADRPLRRHGGLAAAQRLDRASTTTSSTATAPRCGGSRRSSRPRSARVVVRARARGRRRRALPARRARQRRRRVPLGAGALRPAAARRRGRARREPDRGRAADRRRPARACARSRGRPPSPDELPPAPELLAAIAGAVGLEGAEHGYAEALGTPTTCTPMTARVGCPDDALRRRPLPVLRPRQDRPRREGHPARDRRRRPRRPPGVDLREEPAAAACRCSRRTRSSCPSPT